MKHFSYILFALACWSIIGCKKTLEKTPLAQIEEANAYVSADDARRAVTAAYAPTAGNNWCCTYIQPGYMHWVLGNVASDDTEKGGESGSDQLYAQQVSLFNIPSDNDATRFAWQVEYVGIRRTNLVLDKVSKIEMDAALRNRYLAEAKFLRAWYYFNLVRTFGDVPLILSSEITTFDMVRTPKQEVYNQIIKDLTEAESVLPERSGYAAADHGRATKGAAQAYLGKVYLYLKNYLKAEEWFLKVLPPPVGTSTQYELDPDYLGMFFRGDQNTNLRNGTRPLTSAGELSKEHIFQVKFVNDAGASPANNNNIGTTFGSRARNGWGFNLPTQDFVNEFEPGDPRLGHTVYKNGDIMPEGETANVGNSTTGYLTKKYYVPRPEFINGSIQAGRDDIYMRVGKAMLWYAEAANENGNTAAALKALNEVRRRARETGPNRANVQLTVLPPVTETNKDALRQLIWHEQRVEFGQEYERFFELVRQGRAGTVLRAYAAKYNTSKGQGFREGVNEVFPVPQLEINLSKGKITQNPGY
ncbi:MAG: RagB/SusD family nutrient uptake outer membrane protein [Bacteroidota bacterium]|nr:RagB/SusD family nutrient uptake outer membrane protein [Bacteroidota bacterium]